MTLALLGGAALVSVITVLVTSLKTYTVTPADVLPADATLLLFSSADDVLLRQYEPWMPILQKLPGADVPRTVAVLQGEDGNRIIVIFARRPVAPDALPSGPQWTQREVGPLLVSSSSPDIFPLLEAPLHPLSTSQAFAALARGETERSPWIFMRRSLLPEPQALTDTVLSSLLLASATHIGIIPHTGASASVGAARAENGMVVRFFPANSELRPQPLPSSVDASLFSIAHARPTALLASLKNGLSQEQRLLLDTRILTFIAKTFGEDVSFTYDIQPLLTRPSRLSFGQTASGTLALLLQGSAPDPAAHIERLHEAFRGSRTTARTVTRIFGGRYTFRNTRDDTTMMTDTYEAIGGMQVHRTIHVLQGEFCSATAGEEFMLTTDCTLLERILRARLLGTDASAIAAGTFSRTALSALLENTLPTLLGPSSPLLPPASDNLQWSLSRQGDTLTLTLLPALSKVEGPLP